MNEIIPIVRFTIYKGMLPNVLYIETKMKLKTILKTSFAFCIGSLTRLPLSLQRYLSRKKSGKSGGKSELKHEQEKTKPRTYMKLEKSKAFFILPSLYFSFFS